MPDCNCINYHYCGYKELNLLQQIIELEAENKRLREALEESKMIHRDNCSGGCSWDNPVMLAIMTTHNQAIDQALSQPAPTTGILELAAAAYKRCKANKEAPPCYTEEGYLQDEVVFWASEDGLSEAYEALPPETRKMLEDLQ